MGGRRGVSNGLRGSLCGRVGREERDEAQKVGAVSTLCLKKRRRNIVKLTCSIPDPKHLLLSRFCALGELCKLLAHATHHGVHVRLRPRRPRVELAAHGTQSA